ncbi:MAG TPA: hypothetical protein ENN09_06670 [Planctomycetes bacterium]|nr:hypothetical protein [Planctomycetota bacterium]
MRLERLMPFECSASLWVRVNGLEDHVTVAVQNGALHRYWKWAEEKRPLEGEMAHCMSSGEITEAAHDDTSRFLTVLAPVRDSLGDVVALVELTARNPAVKSLAPAWS